MFKKIASLIPGKKKANDVQNVKKVTNTADNIISKAVADAGNISNITLSKEEQKALLEQRKKVPFYIIVMKYSSILLFAILFGVALFVKADLDTNNTYFGALGLQDNTGSKYKKLKTENNQFKEEINRIESETQELITRMEEGNYGIYTDQIDEIKQQQKHWFTASEITTNIETGESEVKTHYGILDAVNEMIDFFQDANYQIRYFAKKEKELLGDKWETCRNPYISAAKKAEIKCPPPIMIAMKNEVNVRSININPTGANISVNVSDILSKVFTLGSEFVDMMNSFPFYRDGSIRSFTRRKASSGEENMEISLRLEFQDQGEDAIPDPADENFQYFEAWKNLNKTINNTLEQARAQSAKSQSENSSASEKSSAPRTRTSNTSRN